MQQIHWTEQEYNTLAQALRQQFPDRAEAQVATPEQFVFTTHEVGVVMRASLPRERQRAVSKGMARKLATRVMHACGVTPGTPRKRKAPLNGFIHWTQAEWRYYALSLVTMFPQLDLVNSEDLAQLRLSHLNKASSMMEPSRQRTFNARPGPIKYLLEVYATARKTDDPMFIKPGRPQPDTPLLPQAEPVSPTPTPAKSRHAAAASCKVFWTKSEWVSVAAELHRQYPHAKYPEKNHLGSLNSADVAAAQFVLPEQRRRKNLKLTAMTSLRAPLLEAFKAVRHMMQEELQQRAAEAQLAHNDMMVRAATAAVLPNQWEIVFKPLIELISREVGAQLLPALIEGLHQAGHIAVPRPTPPAHLSLASAPPKTAPTQPQRKAVMRIAIVGNDNKNSYAGSLDREFPNIDFVYLDKHFDAAKNCDKIIGLVRFISHSTEGKVKRMAGDRYVPVNGGGSDMKRVISGWLSDAAEKRVGVVAA